MSNEEKVYKIANLLTESDFDETRIQNAVQEILIATGENPQRQGLERTPERVSEMYKELLAGYRTDPYELLKSSVFEEDYDEMVLVRDIEFYSICEHHMIPFIGRVHVAYIADGRVIGLSQIPKIVDMFARRLQVQERMTRQIADLLAALLEPKGVGVVVEALHLCSMMRGVKKQKARMTTTALTGLFRSQQATRQEFMESISRGADALSV
ncbi:MAG: GTP cyclohydrolase I FolE [Chloroflexi bacterium]|jgi:GTP cyclohydrolase I|nr:GTP cyclohydrolase I FolE [Chloroflexota bacterium]MBT3670459.1 GTP cyclohydrolase I FolE [Chloroflexota bacterium]MBT4002290.1 GTP cyclohydrolase I FolE [Chloroflexota bacterium]MBT4304639.1 GTP cyclohydrolase I FolE [Chloroflexota bacterium]MBT4534208.1 GTP cyclohydrolase I FolE [Chloroflexota bacterium]